MMVEAERPAGKATPDALSNGRTEGQKIEDVDASQTRSDSSREDHNIDSDRTSMGL